MAKEASSKKPTSFKSELKAAGLEVLRTEPLENLHVAECSHEATNRKVLVERGPDYTMLSTDSYVRTPTDLPNPFRENMDSFKALGLLTQLLPRDVHARFVLSGEGVQAIRLTTVVPGMEPTKTALLSACKRLVDVVAKIPSEWKRLDLIRDELSKSFGYQRMVSEKSAGKSDGLSAAALAEVTSD